MALLFWLFVIPLWAKEKVPKPESVKIFVTATKDGFDPDVISVNPGKDVKLIITRNPASSCTSDFQIPEKKIKKKLLKKKSTSINLGVLEKGSLHFGCGNEMTAPGIIYVK